MQCPIKSGEGTELLLAYGARTLTPEAAASLDLHLADCAECRRVAGAQRAVWSALDTWEPLPISSDFDQKLYRRIAAEEELPWYRRLSTLNWSFRPAMPVAAACATVLAAFLLKGPLLETKPEVAPPSKGVDIEQVERALDDINMLQQLGVVPPASGQSARPESM